MKWNIILSFLTVLYTSAQGCVLPLNYEGNSPGLKEKQYFGSVLLDVTLNDRLNCSNGSPQGVQPSNRVNTTVIVANLRAQMASQNFDAYVIPSADAHQSEYVATADQRRVYVTGVTGSAGTAVVTTTQQAMWTDGRYFLQADQELDCNWLFMKSGEDGVPTIAEWLVDNLSSGSVVGVDARLVGATTWQSFEATLAASGITLQVEPIPTGENIVDVDWSNDVSNPRPSYSLDEIVVHEIEYAGVSWQDKIRNVVSDMATQNANVSVFTALDETAWMLNLRGADIPYNPVFRSYVIVDAITAADPQVQLYVPDIPIKVTQEVRDHLLVDNCVPGDPCVSLFDYDTIESGLTTIANNPGVDTVLIPDASLSSGVSYFIYNLVPESKRIESTSSVLLAKAQKNNVEIAALRNATIRDSVAVISFLAFFEDEMNLQNPWTEIEAQDRLVQYRALQEDFIMESFGTISAFGAHASVIHYTASTETDAFITDQSTYLLDSGGQYKGGTTDVTRTLHYGTPSSKIIEAYTRVLMGVIDFARIVYPAGTFEDRIDIVARRALYEAGLDYRHGTSHGIGLYLNVHEPHTRDYKLGNFVSDEPGYYEDNEFGIRLESDVLVVPATTTYDFVEESYTMETLTLVPYEPNLINLSLLNKDQCAFLDSYNQQIQATTGPLLDQDSFDWMMSKTSYTCS